MFDISFRDFTAGGIWYLAIGGLLDGEYVFSIIFALVAVLILAVWPREGVKRDA